MVVMYVVGLGDYVDFRVVLCEKNVKLVNCTNLYGSRVQTGLWGAHLVDWKIEVVGIRVLMCSNERVTLGPSLVAQRPKSYL